MPRPDIVATELRIKSMYIIWSILIICATSGCTLLESRINYSFTDESISEKYISRGGHSCETRSIVFGLTPRYQAKFVINNELDINIDILDSAIKTVSIGPGFLIPLPIIPWPPGIFSSSTKESLSIRITFSTQYSGYAYNSFETYLLVNGNVIPAKVQSEKNIKPIPVTNPLIDHSYIYDSNLYIFDSSKFDKSSIYLHIDGISQNEKPIHISPMKLELINLTELNWLWGSLNC